MAITLRASEQGLLVVNLARQKKGWAKTEEAWFQLALTSKATLKRFWERKPVQQETFIALCQAVEIKDWQSIVDETPTISSSSRSLSFSAYNQETWVGREETLSALGNRLQENTRLLLISGFTGIGKTALAERLADDVIQTEHIRFEFHRISFDIEGQSQDFTTGAAAILAELGDKELDPQERNDPQRLSDRLLQKLQTKSYWIQLDALERLLPKESAEFVDPHWLSFFQRCLGSSNFPSRLVLTTQTSPTGFEEFVDRYPTLWREETLQGLSAAERLELFARNGIATNEINRATIDRIGQIYEGHPLVLQVIAREILAQPFNGNVAQYWERYGNEFEQVARELQQSQRVNPALYSRELQNRVRQRVEKSLKRLPTDALDLLCRASVYRRPVPETFWLALLNDRSPTQQQEAYRTLGDRALVEQEGIHQGQFLIRQHNLIRDIAYDLLRQDDTTWKTAERQAAELWLTAYEPAPDAPNLEQRRGYLETFHHLCEIESWREAKEILVEQEVGIQLQTWGYYKEMIPLYNRLLSNLDPSVDFVCRASLGSAYYSLSNYFQAIEQWQQSLTITRTIGNHFGEGIALGNLGLAYHFLGEYHRAVEHHLQALRISLKIGNREEEGRILGNLGLTFESLGMYHQAIECHQKHLNIAYDFNNRKEEADALGNLGNAYYCLKNYSLAIGHYQQWRAIACQIDYRNGEANALGSLGNVYSALGDYSQSINYYQQSLIIKRQIGEQYGEGRVLISWAGALLKLEQYSEALKHLQTGLEICKKIGDRANEAEALLRLAELHQKTGEIDLAKQYCDRALELAIELGIPLAKECRKLKDELEKGGG